MTSQDECPLSSLRPISVKNFDPVGNAPDSKGLVDKRTQKSFTKDLKKIDQLLAPFESNMLDGKTGISIPTDKEPLDSPSIQRQITFANDDIPDRLKPVIKVQDMLS